MFLSERNQATHDLWKYRYVEKEKYVLYDSRLIFRYSLGKAVWLFESVNCIL